MSPSWQRRHSGAERCASPMQPLVLHLLAAAALTTCAQEISTMATDDIRAALRTREDNDASEVEAAESFDGRVAAVTHTPQPPAVQVIYGRDF